MVYCDLNENILEWGSEEIAIPYRSPVDRKIHRYFPDFYVKLKETTGKIKKYIIEVKPKKQLKPPTKPKRKTKSYLYEAYEYARNQAKWKAATEYCKDRLYEFKVIPMTLDLNVSFLAPTRQGKLIAKAEVIKLGKSTAFMSSKLYQEEELVATSSSTVRLVTID